jgi:hypothetical protein
MSTLPGWDSLERVTWFSNVFQILGLTSLALLVIFDVLAFAYGHRRDALLARQAAPRSLSADQKAAIVNFLQGQPKGSVTLKASVSAPDARAYADQIATLLGSAGWMTKVDNALFAGPNTAGVWITIKDPQNAPPAAGVLQHALRAAEIEARGEYDPTMADVAEVWLSIGSK